MTTDLSTAPLAPNSMRENRSLFTDSTPLLDDPEALRARAEAEGFLFFKQFLPREPLLELRRQMLEVVRRHGLLAPDHDMMEGVLNAEALARIPDEAMRSDVGMPYAVYLDVQKLELFHTLPHHPKFLSLFRTLFGGDVLPHPRHIARMTSGHRVVHTTPPHQDFLYIQGAKQTWTCWFPVGDCPRTLGGLTALRASHHQGVVAVRPAKGAGGLASLLCPNEIDWVEGDYEIGDVLTFNSCTVHKALPCRQRERIRLSCDIRFQAAGDVIDPGSLKPHVPVDWDELYAGWENSDVQYYWRRHDLKLSPWDESIHWQRDRIC
jgi:hypothetical protein